MSEELKRWRVQPLTQVSRLRQVASLADVSPCRNGEFAPSLPPSDGFLWSFLPGGEVAVVQTLHEPGCPGGRAGAFMVQNKGATKTHAAQK